MGRWGSQVARAGKGDAQIGSAGSGHSGQQAARVAAPTSPAHSMGASALPLRSSRTERRVSCSACSPCRSTLISLGWRIVMGSCVTLGMLASQLWSFKLLRGYSKQQRRVRQLAAAQKEA